MHVDGGQHRGGVTGDLSGISSTERTRIGKHRHRVVIEVDEAGTEAAAAIGVVSSEVPAAPQPTELPKQFIADHPFLFMIRHQTSGTILFQGRMCSPS